MKVKSESEVTQPCPTLQDPIDCSLPGSSIHGICQARVLEWGAIAFSAMNEAGHSNPVLWDNPEGLGGKIGGRGIQDVGIQHGIVWDRWEQPSPMADPN